MFYKLTVLVFAVIFFGAGSVAAAPDDVVSYHLSLAGYQLGMSYDEAVAIRPLIYTQNLQANSDTNDMFSATTEPVFIDDVELDVRVTFKDDVINKVIARFSPAALEDVSKRFQKALGRAEDRSKVIKNLLGKEVRQKVYSWEFPGARMFLVAMTSGVKPATLALVAKRVSEQPAEEEL